MRYKSFPSVIFESTIGVLEIGRVELGAGNLVGEDEHELYNIIMGDVFEFLITADMTS
jgi:hypothetical protein